MRDRRYLIAPSAHSLYLEKQQSQKGFPEWPFKAEKIKMVCHSVNRDYILFYKKILPLLISYISKFHYAPKKIRRANVSIKREIKYNLNGAATHYHSRSIGPAGDTDVLLPFHEDTSFNFVKIRNNVTIFIGNSDKISKQI